MDSRILISIFIMLTSSASLFQIGRIIGRRSAGDLSVTAYSVAELRLAALLALAVIGLDAYSSVPLAFSLAINSIILFLAIKFREKEHAP